MTPVDDRIEKLISLIRWQPGELFLKLSADSDLRLSIFDWAFLHCK